ncbi:MAG: hypothetical protein JW821_02145 [Deltaproteobacteria bacterium]|nr:hypothetical protein [Deltaproteobacteria bacterium]
MGRLFAATGADAIPTRPCSKTPGSASAATLTATTTLALAATLTAAATLALAVTLATAAALPAAAAAHTSAGPRPLAPRACSVSSRHVDSLLVLYGL